MAKEIGNSNLLEVWASSGAVVEPDISKVEEGWQLGEQPPHEFMNWLQNTFGAKLNQILSRGAPDWNSETSWPVAALVNYDGRVWFALSANTNSQPSDVNSNWKTIDDAKSILYDNSISGLVAENVQAAISELQDKKVDLTGDQTVEGVKTFSASPVIPDASLASQPVALGQFTQSLVASGWQKLPSGLIIQWGGTTQVTSSGENKSFNISFPAAALKIYCTPSNTTSGRGVSVHSSIQNNSSFNAKALYSDQIVAAGEGYEWFAIGY